MKEAQEIVRDSLRSQGARHTKAATDALTQHLMNGGSPATYGERVAQMALELAGLLERSGSNIE